MAESQSIQKAKQEANQYLQELAAYVKPADKLTAGDLLASIALNEKVEYCEKLMGGTVQHKCMDREIARFKESPRAFLDDFLRSKSGEQRSIYQKMAQKYLDAAEFYLQFLSDKNQYFEKTGEIHENFQRCFSIISAWEYLKLPAADLGRFLRVTDCVTEGGSHE